MSNELLQSLAVAVIVLGAAAFLVLRRVRRKARPSSQCGSCPACAPPAATTESSDWSTLGNPVIKLVRRGKPNSG